MEHIPILNIDIENFSKRNPDERSSINRILRGILKDATKFCTEYGEFWDKHDRHGTGDGYFLMLDDLSLPVVLKLVINIENLLNSYNKKYQSDLPIRLRMFLDIGDVKLIDDQYESDSFVRLTRLIDSGYFKKALQSSQQSVIVGMTPLFKIELEQSVLPEEFDLHLFEYDLIPFQINAKHNQIIKGYHFCKKSNISQNNNQKTKYFNAIDPLILDDARKIQVFDTSRSKANQINERYVRPYMGLNAFGVSDSQFFFGRNDLVQDILEKFEALGGTKKNENVANVFAVIGPSGSGKSSVVKAGFIPELAKTKSNYSQTNILIMKPGSHPIESLADVLSAAISKKSSQKSYKKKFKKLLEAEHSNGKNSGLKQIFIEYFEKTNEIILIVDQFEEVYIDGEEDEKSQQERNKFIDNIMESVTGFGTRISVVITLRIDFLENTQEHSAFNKMIAQNVQLVHTMTREDLVSTIIEPAKLEHETIDISTVDFLVDEIHDKPGALPLLEFALMMIWDGIKAGKEPGETLRRIDGVGGALSGVAQEIYDSLDEDEKVIAQRAFISMVSFDRMRRDTRRRVLLSETVGKTLDKTKVRSILNHFADEGARLITFSADLEGNDYIEVTHEAIFENWETLKTWIEENREEIQLRDRLIEAADEWSEQTKKIGDKSDGFLWRSPLLDRLKDYVTKSTTKLTSLQKRFFEASIENERKTAQREEERIKAILEKEEIINYNKELRDISEDLANELQQKLSQIKLFSQVVELNQDAIITSDSDGLLLTKNNSFLSLFGYSSDEASMKNLKDLFADLNIQGVQGQKIIKEGWQGQTTANRKDGSKFPANISVSPVQTKNQYNKKHEKTVLAVVVRDISLQKQYEQNILRANRELKQTYGELESTLKELEKSNQVKDRFLSNISSQFKTPLDSLINYADLMKNQMQSSIKGNYEIDFLNQIVEEGKKLDRLVGNLIAMAELTSEFALSFDIIRFESIIEELVEKTEYGNKLIIEIDSEAILITADKLRLVQAIIEALDYLTKTNSPYDQVFIKCINHSDRNQIEIRLSLEELKEEADEWEVSQDGIELHFQKAELELPLVKKVIDLHKGEVGICYFNMKECISIKLPLDPSIESGSRFKVMIIDEHEWDRRVLKGIIEKQFVLNEIYELSTQISALNAINALKPNLVIVDPFFSPSQWNFEEFLKKIMLINQSKVSTLVISDQIMDLDMRNKIISLGVTDFLFKPFTIEDALFKINSIIENQQRLFLLANNIQEAQKKPI